MKGTGISSFEVFTFFLKIKLQIWGAAFLRVRPIHESLRYIKKGGRPDTSPAGEDSTRHLDLTGQYL